ncbi:MAG: alpha/beta hydrolase [Verrucomicrobiales bacterium]|jgi:acetyl esterase/lipase|nr:alpha/beta hydrolase [Verrucomicrobiales bacterium]
MIALRVLWLAGLSGGMLATAALAEPEPVSAAELMRPGIPLFDLWPEGKMPGKKSAKPETYRSDGIIFDVNTPTLAVFQTPVSGGGPAPAVVVCPGGGYGVLAYPKEGTEIAEWLNTIGVTGVVLKYRVAAGREPAFQDVQRALRLTRARAREWNINPAKVGVLGFSAGGHLSAWAGANADAPAYAAVDEADELSCRPDFVVLVYPAYLDKDGTVAPEVRVSGSTPPTFIAHTEDDTRHVVGSKIYHPALVEAGVPNEFFLLSTGGHGYGLRSNQEIKVWPERCAEWLRKIGVIGHGESQQLRAPQR